jgi:hypothetical protein
MQKLFTYQSSLFKDSYLIFNGDRQIGKLYKKEWLGSPVETTINGHQFKFISSNIFRPVISIFDKGANQSVGTVTINSLFSITPSAKLRLANNKIYRWTNKDIFSHNWKWHDLSDMEIVASSKEPLEVFKQKGIISLAQENTKEELLITLGIHLRNVVQKQNLLIRLLSLVVLALLLPRLFALLNTL